MRFMQLSDVRLGRNTESGKRWGRDRVVELSATLRRVMEKAAETNCELLVIAGGLFSHQPVTSELEEINRLFLSLPAAEIVLIAGQEDCLRRSSPARSFQWAKNVHFIDTGVPQKLHLPRLNTVVYAVSEAEDSLCLPEAQASAVQPALPQTSETQTSELQAPELQAPASASFAKRPIERLAALLQAERAPEAGVRFLVAYEPDLARAKQALSGCSFSYAAIGGLPQQTEAMDGKLRYSGGLEPMDMGDSGPHGVLLGDLSTATGALIQLNFLPLAAAAYVPLMVQVTEEMSAADLENAVKREIERRGVNNIYRIRITGKRDPNTVFDLQALESAYRIETVLDESEPQYDFAALFAEHSQDLIGGYIGALERSRSPRSELETRAMYYAVDALLRTAGKGESHAVS